MKKLLRNKRMFLTLIAGLFVFVAVLGAGTFAWFTGKDTVKLDGSITAATVGVETKDLFYGVFDIHNNSLFGFQVQSVLEANYALAADVRNAEFIEMLKFSEWMKTTHLLLTFLKDGVDTVTDPLTEEVYSVREKMFAMGLIFNAFTKKDGVTPVTDATPGSLIVTQISFSVKEKSSIPVYFRTQLVVKEAIDRFGEPIELKLEEALWAKLIGVPIDGKDVADPVADNIGLLKDLGIIEVNAVLKEVDGWYYCNLPLSPLYAWEVDLTDIAYLYGEANGNEAQGAVITFVNNEGDDEVAVEVIQGTNNAVNMADGWADAAEFDSLDAGSWFYPYTTDVFAMYQTYKDYWKE